MSVFLFKEPGVPTVCMFGTEKKANCVSEVQVARGRVTTDSTDDEWRGKKTGVGEERKKEDGVGVELLRKCFERLASEQISKTPECKLLTAGKTYDTFFAAVPIIVTATAGARRTVIAKTLQSKTVTDFVKATVVLSLKEAAGGNDKVQGGVIDGAMEGYFGYMSAAMLLTSTDKQLGTTPLAVQPSLKNFRKNFAFLEIGGASQQFAWWNDAISTQAGIQVSAGFKANVKKVAAASAAPAAPKSGFLEVQGDMVHQFPKIDQFTVGKPTGDTQVPTNKVYAASLLGTGGDRMDIALIK